jgi:hypothetical protein
MFGLNDNNSQSTDNNSAVPSGPVPTPANPFNDGPAPAPVPPPPTPPAPVDTSSPPFSVPDLTSEPVAIPPPSNIALPPNSNLIELKQQALQSLKPLVSHLDQLPEEKFKTTMMLIQATDNSELVKEAYEAANRITDEKARAQALLDVVNEINYFTHKENSKP